MARTNEQVQLDLQMDDEPRLPRFRRYRCLTCGRGPEVQVTIWEAKEFLPVNAGHATAPWITSPKRRKAAWLRTQAAVGLPRYRTASYTRALSDSGRVLVNATPVFAVRVDMNQRTVCACPPSSGRLALAEPRMW